MNTDPYAAPQADLNSEGVVVPSSLWKAHGRLSMLSYWAHTLVLTIVFTVAVAILVLLMGVLSGGFEALASGGQPNGTALIVALVIGIPAFIALMWVSICMIVKRLHDRNHTGWMSLLFLVPLVNIIFSLYALLFPGNKTSNRYGAPRPTKGWEKVLGILMLVFYIVGLVGAIAGPMIGMSQGL